MSSVELISEQWRNGALVQKGFGEAFYIVTAYGMLGLGTDETSKLQAIVNDANAKGRTAIFFPHGTYYVTGITGDENIYYFGDNATFIGGYARTILQIGSKQNDEEVNVKDYGAKGDGITDDSQSIKDAVAYLKPKGGTLVFPSGRYIVTSEITVDITGNIPQNSGKGISIRGENANTTVIVNASANAFVFNVINTNFSGDSTNAYLSIENLMVTGNGANTPKGIRLSGYAHATMYNVTLFALDTGVEIQDVNTLALYSCNFNQNTKGFNAIAETTLTAANLIEFHSCCFYGNSMFAAYLKDCCNVNFYGGTVESNGGGASGLRWGIKLDTPAKYAAVGCTFVGTYFESNQTVADVWINHGEFPATYTFIGCSFTRTPAPKEVTNNINVTAGSNLNTTIAAKLIVIGCGFRSYARTPDAAKRYIKIYTGGTIVHFEESGNSYNDQVEYPDACSNRVFAHGRFVSMSAPELYRGFNIASIVRHSIGDYTITFTFPSVIPERVSTFGLFQAGFVAVVSESTTTMRINVFNASNALIDPSVLMMQITS